jgi:hypothetical protein
VPIDWRIAVLRCGGFRRIVGCFHTHTMHSPCTVH